MNSFKFYTLFLMILLNLSCSRVRWTLGWADEYVSYEVSNQFNLNNKQEDQLEPIVEAAFKEIKSKIIPLFVLQLNELLNFYLEHKKAPKSAEVAKRFFEDQYEKLNQIKNTFYQLIEPKSNELSKILNEDNWLHFQDDFNKKTELIKKNDKKSEIETVFEFFMGDLSSDQEKSIESWKQLNPSIQKLRIENRNHVFKNFRNALGKFSQESLAKNLSLFLTKNDDLQLDRYKIAMKERSSLIIQLMVKLHLGLSQQQVSNIIEKTSELKSELSEFSLEGSR